MFLLLPILAILVSVGAPAEGRCSVGPLRNNPEGYFWPLWDVQGFVDSAEVIVRARAVQLVAAQGTPLPLSASRTAVEFEVVEVLKGDPASPKLPAAGSFTDKDDFNPSPVPYRIVRLAGQRGDCFASEYKRNAEYLLLLRRRFGVLTPYWAPLAPLNEQIRGFDDPWLQWVRSEIS